MAAPRKTTPRAEAWMSLSDAARALGETRQTVLTRAVKGEVEAQHIAGRTLVSRASVEKLVRKIA